MTTLRRLTALCLLGLGLLAVLAGPAQAADDASIDHSEHADGHLQLLVSVPGDATVDLGSVTVTFDGKPVEATARTAASTNDVQRTTVLAIDTSQSMKGAKITEAKAAANTYLDTVPANVAVGIVTFDNDVAVRLAPSMDRNAARAVINGLTLKLKTSLYDGVKSAITATGRLEMDASRSAPTPALPPRPCTSPMLYAPSVERTGGEESSDDVS